MVIFNSYVSLPGRVSRTNPLEAPQAPEPPSPSWEADEEVVEAEGHSSTLSWVGDSWGLED